MDNKIQSSNSEIKRLLLLFATAFGTAILLALLMLYTYGPTGRYVVKNILLSPTTLQTLKYEDNRGHDKLVFNAVEFSYFDAQDKQFKRTTLSLEQYSRLYGLIESDESIDEKKQDFFKLFNTSKLAKLVITVKSEKNDKNIVRQFQEVEFLKEADLYRVQLRQDQAESSYVYFYHAGLARQMEDISLQSL